MLTRSQRISKKEFIPQKSLYQFIKTPYFSVKVRKNMTSHVRFAFVISKKIDKRAVVRNTLKRRMSTAVGVLPQPTVGYDMLFFLRKESLSLSQEQIRQQVQELVTKYKLI